MARIIDGEKMNLIGENVKKYRKNHKLSQQELSNRLELLGVYICRGSVSRIEDGSRTVTDIELLALSKVLNVEIKDYIIKKARNFNSVLFVLFNLKNRIPVLWGGILRCTFRKHRDCICRTC